LSNKEEKKTHTIAARITQEDYLSAVTNAEALGLSGSEYFRQCVSLMNESFLGGDHEGISKKIKREEKKRELLKQQFLFEDAEREEEIRKLKEFNKSLKTRKKAEGDRATQDKLKKKYMRYNSHLQIPNLYKRLTDESLKDTPFFEYDTKLKEIQSNRDMCVEVVGEITQLVECGDAELIPLDDHGVQYKLIPNGGQL